jgi:hypothetical protein
MCVLQQFSNRRSYFRKSHQNSILKIGGVFLANLQETSKKYSRFSSALPDVQSLRVVVDRV